MQRTKQIAIILTDTLQCIGLQSMLTDYFEPVEVAVFPSFAVFMAEGNEQFDYYFTDSATFVLNTGFFLPRKSKTVLLIQEIADNDSIHSLSIHSSPETIIKQLRIIFTSESSNPLPADTGKELSIREKDVLHLIVKGSTNKEIADKLNISLNTVLTHRKNITTKLGIKTVSGLTYYAIMNGFLSTDDIDI
ncbi:MAG: LuxR C-terminal-related transcriptional regulator [Tannerellaceae bacterium]|nr:LuxR C-terminal-related transcriptional regulator [Tannerellaceae bacterium]